MLLAYGISHVLSNVVTSNAFHGLTSRLLSIFLNFPPLLRSDTYTKQAIGLHSTL